MGMDRHIDQPTDGQTKYLIDVLARTHPQVSQWHFEFLHAVGSVHPEDNARVVPLQVVAMIRQMLIG
jgi:hypothetical protein